MFEPVLLPRIHSGLSVGQGTTRRGDKCRVNPVSRVRLPVAFAAIFPSGLAFARMIASSIALAPSRARESPPGACARQESEGSSTCLSQPPHLGLHSHSHSHSRSLPPRAQRRRFRAQPTARAHYARRLGVPSVGLPRTGPSAASHARRDPTHPPATP